MVSSMISQEGYIEIPFKQVLSFSNTHTGSSRFTIATQSLDRIWTAWRSSGYDTLHAPVPVPAYSTSVGAATTAGVLYLVIVRLR